MGIHNIFHDFISSVNNGVSSVAVIISVIIISVPLISYYLYKSTSKTAIVGNNDVSKSLAKEEKMSVNSSKDFTSDEKVLNPATFKKFKLIGITEVSHNTKMLRFEIPSGKSIDLPIGRHISVRATVDGTNVSRAYTPTSRPDKKGFFDLLIKVYEFGKMSQYLHHLKIGDELDVRGPIGRFKYTPNTYTRIGLIAGGTGLTPCLQVMRCVLEGPEANKDQTCFTFFFQNRTVHDILLKKELDDLQASYPNRISIFYFLSNPTGNLEWGLQTNERRGYITTEMIHSFMKPKLCQYIGICGPSAFNDFAKNMLFEAGHTSESVYVW